MGIDATRTADVLPADMEDFADRLFDLVQTGSSQLARQSWDSETSDQVSLISYRCVQSFPVQKDNNVFDGRWPLR